MRIGKDVSPKRPQSNENSGFGETALPRRKILRHDVPAWVPEGATFFITINSLPRGQNQLAIPAVATALMESIATRVERGQWWPRLVLFMPDHLHALIVFPADQDLTKVVRDWKRYTARNAGIRWQRDFFDHRIRNEQSLAEKWHYVAQNPVRAGLVPTPGDWPYVWIGRDGRGKDGSPSRPNI
jgi:putative transposase